MLHKPVMRTELREGAETEYGTPQPVVVVEFDEQMHYRAGEAFLHWLAAEISLLSSTEQWTVQLEDLQMMGKGRGARAVVKMELADGTHDEAVRCMAMLEQAVAAIAEHPMVAVLCGGVLTERRR